MDSSKRKVHVFIISDGTGITAERVITAALVQFKKIDPDFKRLPYIKTKEQINNILARAEKLDAIVIYSLVSRKLREWISTEKRKKNLYTIDLLGPLLNRLARLWDMIPALRPGLLDDSTAESLRLAESIDYTLKHDDGQCIETLGKADIIILGISRTSKTPTSLYLSCNHNLKVANVPIIENVPPPKQIFTLNKRKIGFKISPKQVAMIRRKRFLYAGQSDYINVENIRKELLYSYKIFRQINDLQIIDVTNNSIEEIAGKII